MMARIIIISLLLVLIGCKTPQFTANTKSDLSKLCVYEFPYNSKPIQIDRDTIVISNVEIVRDSIDCTDKQGIQHIYIEVPADTIKITETRIVDNPAQAYYIQDLEFKNEKLEESSKAYKNKYMRLWAIVLLLGAMLIAKLIRR